MTKPVPFIYNATVVRVIDGDTIECDLDLGMNLTARFPVRLLGVNAPELGTEAGMTCKCGSLLRKFYRAGQFVRVCVKCDPPTIKRNNVDTEGGICASLWTP